MLDLLITGGGPAGLAFDRGQPPWTPSSRLGSRQSPRDKACGEGLMPSGLEQLARWGVRSQRMQVIPSAESSTRTLLRSSGCLPCGSGTRTEAAAPARGPAPPGSELGVEPCWKTEVRELEPGRLLTSRAGRRPGGWSLRTGCTLRSGSWPG